MSETYDGPNVAIKKEFTFADINAVNEPMGMLDVETLGTRPHAPIVAIALVIFIPDTGEIIARFYQRIDIISAIRDGRGQTDPETIKFWLGQSTEAQREIIGTAGRDENVWNVRDCLTNLGEFLIQNQPAPGKLKYFANGANFDPVLLDECYRRLGLNPPLRFWKSLDVRTIVELGRQIGIDPKAEALALGTPHKALADCELQIGYVSEIWQRLLAPHTRQYAVTQRNIR